MQDKFAAIAERDDISLFGVKGKSVFDSLIDVPIQVLFDYMHLCLQGHTKWILTQLVENKSSDCFLSILIMLTFYTLK